MTTRKEVAKRAGVSVATVSNVLNNKGVVLPETMQKVRRAVDELGYVPNETARNLSFGRSNHIGIALNEFENPYHMEVIRGIEEHASARGFHISICNIDGRNQSKLEFLNGRHFDALIDFMTLTFSDKILDFLLANQTLLVNFPVKPSLWFHFDCENAILESMELLRANGHTRVGYVSTIDSLRWINDPRGKIYNERLEEFGFVRNDEYRIFNDDYTAMSSSVGYENGLKLFRKFPEITAVYVSNDIAALGVMRALSELGLKCPEDVSVIGYDGISIGRLLTTSLTTIGCDNHAYGGKMAEHIIDCLTGKSADRDVNYAFEVRLIRGESVAPCKRP